MTAETTGKIIVAAFVIMTVFVSLSAAVQQVQPETVPSLLVPIWEYVVAFFTLGQVTTAIGFIISISGYLKNYFLSNRTETYDFDKLAKTLTIYIGIITSLLAAIEPLKGLMPEPYGEYIGAIIAIGAVIIVILDLTKTQLAELIHGTTYELEEPNDT